MLEHTHLLWIAGTITLLKSLPQDCPGSMRPGDSTLCGEFLTAIVRVAAAEMPEHSFSIQAADSPYDRASTDLKDAGQASPYDEDRSSANLLWQPNLVETAQGHATGGRLQGSSAYACAHVMRYWRRSELEAWWRPDGTLTMPRTWLCSDPRRLFLCTIVWLLSAADSAYNKYT